MKKILAVFIELTFRAGVFLLALSLSLVSAAAGQATLSGSSASSGASELGFITAGPQLFFAALPLNYVDNTICNPPGQVYDTTIILGTSVNNGPNVASVALGGVYPATSLGLLDAMNNWRDNGANVYGSSGYSDNWWLIQVPAQSSGTVLSSNVYDANTAMISLPGKLATPGGAEPSKCLVIDSTTPLPAYNVAGSVTSGTFVAGEQIRQSTSAAQATLMNTTSLSTFTSTQLGPMYLYPSQANMYAWVGQTSGAIFTPTSTPSPFMACGRGLPGLGGTRNPGCASPNDKANMWKVQLPSPQTSSHIGIYAGADLVTSANWVNHIVLRDVEVTLAGGAVQGAADGARLFYVQPNPLRSTPCNTNPSGIGCRAVDRIGLERYYIHGNDPGDSGQPTTGTSVDSAGNCTGWDNSGMVTVASDSGNPGTSIVTFASGSYFGMTLQPGSLIYLGGTANTPFSGTAYTIANTSYTQGVVGGAENTQISITGSVTESAAVVYNQVNPPSQYTPGCGDTVEDGVVFNADDSWREDGYIEKIHWPGGESHASLQGFSNGPYKDVNNWEEGGSAAWFSGGAAVDQSGGPESDLEIRRNYFGRDLNYRQLSATSGNSPAPPWGCGTVDGNSSHNTCPFGWGIKNSMEMKLGHRDLVDGNVIENSWADGQQGFCVLVNARTCSGGEACGIYNPLTGLPNNYIDNIRFSNNWVRNCPEPVQMSNRSGSIPNGGGVSLPVQNNDFINNLFTNISDYNQWGRPGTEWEWTSGQDQYRCTMTATGSIVTAGCLPMQSDLGNPLHIGGISSAVVTGTACTNYGFSSPCSQVTVASITSRWDPALCTTGPPSYNPGVPSTCIANGQMLVISNHPGWNGAFAMTGTTGNWLGDGTGGNGIVYIDNINNPGTATLCGGGGSTCVSTLETGDITFASLGYKMTDISVGDDVYAANVGTVASVASAAGNGSVVTYNVTAVSSLPVLSVGLTVTITGLSPSTFNCTNCTVSSVSGSYPQTSFTVGSSVSGSSTGTGSVSDTSCTANGYAVGAAPPATYAIAGTVTTGLTVVYPVSATPTGSPSNCIINNGAGFPKYTTVQNNTILAVNSFNIEAVAQWWLPISNSFFNNVFADNDIGKGSDVTCVPIGAGEGSPSFACWDTNTFEFYGNVMTGRNAADWGNGIPIDPLNLCSGSNCANIFPSLSSSYPAGSCGGSTGAGQVAAAPFNCSLMALPWSSNFSLSNLSSMSGSYTTQGVSTTQLNQAMKQTEYVCPTGANCGTHGPFPD
jgi:hypothetical protein